MWIHLIWAIPLAFCVGICSVVFKMESMLDEEERQELMEVDKYGNAL